MSRAENIDRLNVFLTRLCEEFEIKPSEDQLLTIMVEELGGYRITVPSLQDLQADLDREKIKAMFTGDNYKELAAIFGKHPRTIRRIVNGE